MILNTPGAYDADACVQVIAAELQLGMYLDKGMLSNGDYDP